MQKILSVIVAGLLGFSVQGYSQTTAGKKYTLKECIETGIANNLAVKQSDLDVQASEVNLKQARLNLLPDLNGQVGHGINQGRSIDPFTNTYINERVNFASYNLSSGVVLFNGLARQNAIRQNAYNYQASKMDWQQAKDDLTLDIIIKYLEVLTNEDVLLQVLSRYELSRDQVTRLEALNNEGAVKPSDLYDLRGQRANDQLTVIDTRASVERSKLDLCRLMNIKYDKSMELERIDPTAYLLTYAETPTQIYEKALNDFAFIKSAELTTKGFEKALKVARGQLFPTLSLNGSANSNYSSAAMQNIFINTTEVTTDDYVLVNGSPSAVIRQQNNFDPKKIGYTRQLNNNIFTQISLNLRIPLFNSFRQRNTVKLAKLDLKNSVLTEQTAKTDLQQNVERAYVNMSASFERYKTLLDQVNAYTESFRAAEIRFNEGVGNSIDYLTAKNNLDRANLNLIVGKYDYVFRTKILDYYQGKVGW